MYALLIQYKRKKLTAPPRRQGVGPLGAERHLVSRNAYCECVRENEVELALRQSVVRPPTRARITVAELENAVALMVFEHASG